MKRSPYVILLSLPLIFGLLTAPAGADIIVDTGHQDNFNIQINSTGYQSRFASEFTTSQDWTLTSIKAWIQHTVGTVADSLTWAIYSGGPGIDVPTGAPLYSVTYWGPAYYTFGEWYGPTVNWSLPAGTYWVALLANNDPAGATIGGLGEFAPNGLGNDARWDGSKWDSVDAYDFTWQVSGTAVPIPAAAWLLGSGLAGLAALRRMRTGR